MATITLQPSAATGKDTYIDAGNPTFNYGVATTMTTTGSSPVRRSFIQFDLSSIPANVIITSAILTLTNVAFSGGPTTTFNRITTAWFEGSQNGAAPTAGQDGSTYNLRNANGSVAYTAGAGGDIGTTIGTIPFGSFVGGGANTVDLTSEVQGIYAGSIANNGWAFITGGTFAFTWASSDNATSANRPKLVITYVSRIIGSSSGTSTASATLRAKGSLVGSSAGSASSTARLISNQSLRGTAAGTSTASAVRTANAFLKGNSFGDSTANGFIRTNRPIIGSTTGSSTASGRLVGRFSLQGSSAGQGTASAHLSSKGQIRGSANGVATAVARGYARAINVTQVIGCNPVPLLYITNGSVKTNGQLNILNFLAERSGFLLVNYKPQIAQYKDGGSWSSSAQSQGRRLRGKVFDNAIDVLELAATASDQDSLVQYQQDLLSFQEAASDYWASDSTSLPYYLVARAARESNTRYALIHMISCPELENPYSQPFFDIKGAAFASLTVRIERGIWTSTPPGKFDCVEISGQREWTVSGWQVGS